MDVTANSHWTAHWLNIALFQQVRLDLQNQKKNPCVNHFASFGPQFRQKAAQVVSSLQESSDVEIVAQSPERFEAALSLYSQRLDKEWGLTDCDSFLIMQQRGLTEVLAHDEHFVQAGFIALLR